MNSEHGREGREHPVVEAGRRFGDESGIIVFGGGNGCAGRGCLFWILLSVGLTVGLNLILFLISLLFSAGPGVIGV